MTKIGGYEIHPAADLFPMMGSDELAELARDIAENGQLEPIVIDDQGVVIDGRNRLKACTIAGKKPLTWLWDGSPGGSVLAFIVSKNVKRRHLDPSQRAMVAADLLPMFEGEARARRLAGLEHGRNRPREGKPPAGGHRATAAKDAAKAVHVGERSVERAKAVSERSPELAEKVRAGEVSLKAAERQVRQREQRAAIAQYVPPVGEYSVIVADPPWQYDARAEDDTHRGRVGYPTMSTDEVCAMRVPAARDCILFLWVTNSFLADGSGARVVEAWGFEPKTVWTWRKVSKGGEPRLGAGNWGRGGTEHLIVAVKGKPTGHDFAKVANCFDAELREHSRKPDELYKRIELCCPHPAKLEMFAREPRAGWTTSGAEGELFAAESEKKARAGARVAR